MDNISNMPQVDENKNSQTLDNHLPENVELSVSPLTSEGVNISPEFAFQSPTSLQGTIPEVNSNITIQSPKNLNTLNSEMDRVISKPEIVSLHDTLNSSLLGETVGSYKSCNGSFLGDVNNSFKSLNGSCVMETSPSNSVKSLLDETVTKVQSPSMQLTANVKLEEDESIENLGNSFNNGNPEFLVEDVPFTEEKSNTPVKDVLDAKVEEVPLPNSDVDVKETVGNAEIVLNNTSSFLSNKSASFSECNISIDSSLPNQENEDDPPKAVDYSGLDGAIAAFSTLKLNDSVVNLSPSKETTPCDNKENHDSSNLMGFTMIQDGPPTDGFAFNVQIDSPNTVDNMNNKDLDSQAFPRFSEPAGDDVPTELPEAFDSALQDDPFGIKGMEFNASPVDDFVFKVPETPVDAENEEFTDAVQFFKDPSSFQFLENIKTSPPIEGNVPRSSLYIKFDPLHSMFPRNPNSSDVLQALKNETSLEANVQCLNLPARESLGNILISFDSPRKTGCQDPKTPVLVAPARVYTEEELQQHLSVNELTNQEILLKKQRVMEEDLARKQQEMATKADEKDKKIAQLENVLRIQRVLLEEFVGVAGAVSEKNKGVVKTTETMEDENAKLKVDVKTLTEDLQSVETTFADFHKRYEQCKGMLKTLRDNEELLKTKLNEQEQAYQELQDSTLGTLEKASLEVSSVKKTSEAQTAVLKAQLKKSELKISSLESDIKQIKIENSQLGGICDDLMEKVGKS